MWCSQLISHLLRCSRHLSCHAITALADLPWCCTSARSRQDNHQLVSTISLVPQPVPERRLIAFIAAFTALLAAVTVLHSARGPIPSGQADDVNTVMSDQEDNAAGTAGLVRYGTAGGQPAQPWFVRLDVPGRDDCYGILLDEITVLTAAACAGSATIQGLRYARDSEHRHQVLSTRLRAVQPSPVSSNTDSAPGHSSDLALVFLRKTGLAVTAPLELVTDASLIDTTWALTHEVVTAADSDGVSTGEGSSVPVVVVNPTAPTGTVTLAPGQVTVAPSAVGYDTVRCHIGIGTPLLAHRDGRTVVVGLVTEPGSCDGQRPSVVALLSAWLPALVDVAACVRNQQMLITGPRATATGCEYDTFPAR